MCKKQIPLIREESRGTSYLGTVDLTIQLTTEGESAYSISSIIFVDMNIFMGSVLAIIGAMFGIAANPIYTKIVSPLYESVVGKF
jgi:hypothetical protein